MFELAQMTNPFEQWWHQQQFPAVISPAVNNDPRADWLPQKWCYGHPNRVLLASALSLLVSSLPASKLALSPFDLL